MQANWEVYRVARRHAQHVYVEAAPCNLQYQSVKRNTLNSCQLSNNA